jgi:plastocyanin
MRALLAAPILLAALLAGCSDSGGQHEPTPLDEGEPILATAQNRFSPPHASISVGETIVWKVTGKSPHNVVADDGSFTSIRPGNPTLTEGEEFSHTFTEAGEYDYECTLHPGMVGTIHVS